MRSPILALTAIALLPLAASGHSRARLHLAQKNGGPKPAANSTFFVRSAQKSAVTPRNTVRPSVSYTCGNVLPLQ